MVSLRLKRKIRKNKFYIITSLIAISISIGFFLLISSEEKEKTTETKAKYEITEVDLFEIKDFNSREISVKGIKLGDSFDSVIKKLGYPDGQSNPTKDIINIEYSDRLDLNGTGLILHFEDNILRRIAFRDSFNKYLIGKTKIQYTKDEIYNIFGKPSDTQFLQTDKASPIVFRNFVYNEIGLEVLIRGPRQIGFSLYY